MKKRKEMMKMSGEGATDWVMKGEIRKCLVHMDIIGFRAIGSIYIYLIPYFQLN